MRWLLAFALLAGCASVHPRFAGGERVEVAHNGVGGTLFRVGDEFQFSRTSRAGDWRGEAHATAIALAIEGATGCAIAPGAVNDMNTVITGRLDCPD